MIDRHAPVSLLVVPDDVGGPDTVVRLIGDLDVATVPVLLEVADQVIAEGAHCVRLDCSRLDYLDSAGLGGLLRVIDRLGPSGALWLHEPNDLVIRILDVTGLTELIRIDDRPLPPGPAAGEGPPSQLVS
ncbi:MAG: Anti-sigma factor antagonist [Acidimicrobiales bacterium]|nr:Anti-sigma factor antagonist [Acidimicrobiales bacterium]